MSECLLNVNGVAFVGMRRMLGRMLHCVRRVVLGLPALFIRLIWGSVNRGVAFLTLMRLHPWMMKENFSYLVRGFVVTRIV